MCRAPRLGMRVEGSGRHGRCKGAAARRRPRNRAEIRRKAAYRLAFPSLRSVPHRQPCEVSRIFFTAGENNPRSEEHTSELQSLMRISYAVFCLKKKNKSEPDHIKT